MTVVLDAAKCLSCGVCAELCPIGAIKLTEEAPVIDETRCEGCGICAAACFAEAITVVVPVGMTRKKG